MSAFPSQTARAHSNRKILTKWAIFIISHDLRRNSLTASKQLNEGTQLDGQSFSLRLRCMSASRFHAVRGETSSISLHIFLWSRAGCRRLWSLIQIVLQLFWTSSWLALAKVSFNGFLAHIGTSCLASVHPMWQLAAHRLIYLWATHDIPAAVKGKTPWWP